MGTRKAREVYHGLQLLQRVGWALDVVLVQWGECHVFVDSSISYPFGAYPCNEFFNVRERTMGHCVLRGTSLQPALQMTDL